MPNINRIRVNNVKYNFGTQMYDDFVMRFHGSNTIYDLANGGGKSVLMLLMMQNVIPNCTLDEKQPIEKLFRTEGGSKTIHSLIEWNLDDSDIEEDYRYMLTGFCARKAKDSSDTETGGRDTASIEYFNYCIFYRAYNSNDIVNFPLDSNGERITYQGLKDYLKQIDKELPELKVYIFDRKGEYQQFISKYGIYESAWEIVRGINKTEGHVRTYFETNYKTTRKVVEDLLIEEIIEKSFRDKTEGDDVNDTMAKTLLEIRDKLMELSEKKSEISRFDRQKEVLGVLIGRVNSLTDLYKQKDELTTELLSAYRSIESQIDEMEKELKSKKKEVEDVDHECAVMDRNISCMKVQLEEYSLVKASKEEEQAASVLENAKKELEQAQAKLETSENNNDYSEYAKIKKRLDEEVAIISKGKGGAGDTVERLYDYASVKKKFLDERLAGTRAKAEEAAKEEHTLKVSLKSLMNKKRDLECDNAVAESDETRLKKQLDRLDKQLSLERKKTSLLLLEDAAKLLREQERKQYQAEKQYRKTETDINKIHETRDELRFKKAECELMLEHIASEGKDVKLLESMIETDKARLDALLATYNSDLNEGTINELLKHLQKRMRRATKEKNAVKEQIASYEHRIELANEGRMIADTELIDEVCDYILERHDMTAISGQDYLLSKSEEERKDLLTNWHFLANAIVIENGDKDSLTELSDDRILRQMLSERMIPAFAESTLTEASYKNIDGVVFLHGREEGFYTEEGFSGDISELNNKLERANLNLTQHEDMVKMYEDDVRFVMKQQALFEIMDRCNLNSDSSERPDYKAILEEIASDEQELDAKEIELKEALEAINAEGAAIVKEVEILENIDKLYEDYQKAAESHQEAADKLAKVKAELESVSKAIDDDNSALKEVRERKKNYDALIFEGEKQWNESYAEYYQGRPILDLGYNEEQLDVEFMSMKAIVEKKLLNLEDKKALVDTLSDNSTKLLNSLKRRGADLEALAKSYAAGDIVMVSSKELDKLSENVKRYRKHLSDVQEEVSKASLKKSKLEGAIEHGKKGLLEQGITYQRVDVEEGELARILEEQNKALHRLVKQKAEMTEDFIKGQKMLSKRQDFYKDVRRLKDLYHLEMVDDDKLRDMSDYTMEQLKHCQEAFEQSMRKEQRARLDLEDYKVKAGDTLNGLGAYELADVIKRDVILPDTISELEDLTISLNDMIGFIALEQERIEQGISDMELIKSNFESQCLLRCQDVKTELSRLPKLSGISLDGEPIQMISLNIPYLSDEEQRESMSSYIDEIVQGVDRYENADDRLRFIRTQLSLKRLFSAVVTDMNAIKLLLYKRERIREQSRYLKYEEAVGSTGQSQGIYIQFLIAIINYIANLHSVNSDNNGLKKVIFIDNPFGAAKDIYIWEPIFEMLKLNNVQLVVPARGATPAITGRFDVNYILGQKLVSGKQQTVVVDYRSQVDKTEVEYKKVDFSQGSFNFI
ncbi:MAG: hypothetical protein K5656_00955 [Lachnospiraceae bacterium]|nr:hypothetical protein [Lachnospiraceae bacterium]